MAKRSKKLLLIKTSEYQGYFVEDVLKTLSRGRAEKLSQWLSERNVTLHLGEELITKEELEFFLTYTPELPEETGTSSLLKFR